jgi:hypothetical protein
MDNDSTFQQIGAPLSPFLMNIRKRMEATQAQTALEDADLAIELRRETGDIRYAKHALRCFDQYERVAEQRQLRK